MGRDNWKYLILIIIGLMILFSNINKFTFADGASRFENLDSILEKGDIPTRDNHNKYSIVGPIFASPLWVIGNMLDDTERIVLKYNFVLFILAIIFMFYLLKDKIDKNILLSFFTILIFASMFSHHTQFFFGEVFTALLVTTGILAINFGKPLIGWILFILGVVNTPATIFAALLVVIVKAIKKRQLRYFTILIIIVALFVGESFLRNGDIGTGYEKTFGKQTIMPYSGMPNFSYPLMFGVLSLLLAFGKGLIFFAPGLLLWLNKKQIKLKKEFFDTYFEWIIFLAGIIIVYSKWWAWYGGWFWGPRFLLMASIPASFSLAVYVVKKHSNIWKNILVLAILALSFWVGLNGVIFGMSNVEECSDNNYALENLCWYTPEFSVLWHPFVDNHSLTSHDKIIIALWFITFIFIAKNNLFELQKQLILKYKKIKKDYKVSKWKF